MCEFCENDKVEKELYYDEENYWFIRKLGDEKYYIFYRNKNFLGAKGIRINNCPMCGRKL